MEINFSHGEPLDLADRVFLFKRTVRETALRHGVFATFMAKPMEQEPGSAMHIHQSIHGADGRNLFSRDDGSASEAFGHYIAGLQTYIPQLMPLFAPYVNSYRRLSPFMSAPINVRWGLDNRTCGIRVPKSGPDNRRVENRVPGVDVNPYLAMAATLACGLLGLRDKRSPSEATTDSAWNVEHELPRHLEDAIKLMRACEPMRETLGSAFVDAFCAVKELEYATYNRVISSWEREHLLLLV
jgi:glutamine synthetase